MKFKKSQDGTSLVYILEGKLDTLSAPDMEKEFMASLEGVTDLTLDFEWLEYVSSAGIRVLLTAFKRLGGNGTMKIVHANSNIREVLEMTRLTDIITVE